MNSSDSGLDGYGTAAEALAVVLAGTTVVTALATALALTIVQAFAAVVSHGGAATLALAVVQAGTTVVAGFAGAEPLTLVQALAAMQRSGNGSLVLAAAHFSTSQGSRADHTGERRRQQLVEAAPIQGVLPGAPPLVVFVLTHAKNLS